MEYLRWLQRDQSLACIVPELNSTVCNIVPLPFTGYNNGRPARSQASRLLSRRSMSSTQRLPALNFTSTPLDWPTE
jgi:hypothetical protein